MYRALTLAGALLAVAALLAPSAASAQFWSSGRNAPYSARGYGRGIPPASNPERNGVAGQRRHCDNGTGGTIIGAIAGGLLGNAAIGRRGDRTAGTIAGAGVGALVGRAADRDC